MIKRGAAMLEKTGEILTKIDNFVWGLPLVILIMAVGIYLTFRLKGLQIRHLPKALKYMIKNEEGGSGEVSSFAALCTALSATIGTGNIVGVATAICAGGPGALLWMIIAALFGMATKYSEGLLAVKFRNVEPDGHIVGGPFCYIENGMGVKWKWLAKIFAFFGVCVGLLGIGTFTQVNGISSAVKGFFDPNTVNAVSIFGMEYSWAVIITGIVLTVCVGLVLIGGIKRISSVSQVVVPFMAILYVLFCVILLAVNIKAIPMAVAEIIQSAFGFRAAAGGFLGAMIAMTASMKSGVARGIFSNEAGLGSAPIAAAAAQTNEPARQGLVTMTGTFIDTVLICTMTGLCIVITGAWNPELSLEGVGVTTYAFQTGLSFLPPAVPSFVLMICLVFFAFTTILGWDYYSEKCLEYLTGGNLKAVKIYRWVYIMAVFIGPYMTVSAVWKIADIFNGLMALPNLVAIIALSGIIAAETKKYFQKLK